jgi:hypothetical protein
MGNAEKMFIVNSKNVENRVKKKGWEVGKWVRKLG